MDGHWDQDFLGHPFVARTLWLTPDDEGTRVATLVAHEPGIAGAPASADGGGDAVAPRAEHRGGHGPVRIRAVLHIHGFSDYFHHAELASALHSAGWAFFALDLHKHGRSLLPHQTPGFVTSLSDYDEDLEAGIAALTERLGERVGGPVEVQLVLMAHSTGGLSAVLWSARHPGRLAALVLNGPWLETQGNTVLRGMARGGLDTMSRLRPKARILLPELGFYFRSISDTRDGEWSIEPSWRPEAGFPIRVGWLAAVLAGHAELAHGVTVDTPILVLCSATSTTSPTWKDSMLESDSILDVTRTVRRAADLGPDVTIRRFRGALHDVFLSRRPVRDDAAAATVRWLGVQVPPSVATPPTSG
ncbi:hypothetical protein AC792_13215 [Arthrobacter sp. RIT-PI-e]|uniref:alpha/beta hydrolase n=1 Tax=Arthrobacter sp. RIT-PI-e TaxID=1681197 RepID=UPI000675EB70|nr:alpha/beta hydrolase [Arthrobacter sp. RIT-PI-e]KNC17804.1 hypothetical protein AC792_13215 [Arthrobacter sp. RIT-PI-e]